MDRFALFVDAGHLLAEGGSLCCGTKKRISIHCDYPAFLRELALLCSARCSLPLLRTYWYDAARDAVPSPEQLLIAQLPFTKLRLGRLSGGKQKGVDSLIVRDLMTLARERAIATAFLLGGDEDLREGILAAQEMGVAVNVLGIPTTDAPKANQAASLIREADEHIVLPTAFLAQFISAAGPVATIAETSAKAVPEQPVSESVRVAATALATSWFGATEPQERARVLAGAPVIPRGLDIWLLKETERTSGANLQDHDDLRKDARAAFWQSIKTLAGS